MSLIKFSNRNRFMPWGNGGLKRFLSSDDFFNDDFFDDDSMMPALNIKEHDDDFQIELAAPGFNKKDFEVTIVDNILNVSGEKSSEEEESEEGYSRREFNYNSFKRSIALPQSVDLNKKVKATYKDGILNLNVLKKEEAQTLKSKKVVEIS